MKLIKHALIALPLLLAGCSTVPTTPVVDADYQERAERLRQLGAWAMTGRAAIQTSDDAGTISLAWRQQGEHYSVNLRAPWGAGTIKVDGGPEGVRLRTGDGRKDFATAPEALLERYTGYQLPLQALRYWLLGVAMPGEKAAFVFDDQGLLTRLEQHGWRIEYRRYQEYDGYVLPRIVFMSGEGIELRVAVRDWELNP